MTGGVNSVKKPLYFITFDYVDNEILFERDENGSLIVEQREELSSLSVGKYKYFCNSHSSFTLTMACSHPLLDISLSIGTPLRLIFGS